MANKSRARLVMTILVALMMATGFVLPDHARMLRHDHSVHDHSANAGLPSMAMGDHHALQTAGSGPGKREGACGTSCPTCAMTCCGVILPAMAVLPSGAVPPHAVFAEEPRLGRGVPARLDPYPPRRTA